MSSAKTIVVTGANRGIGLAICKSILKHPNTASSPLTLYATSRSGADLELAVEAEKDHKVIYKSLDISDARSIVALKKTIQEAGHPVDVLINNAGVNLDSEFSFPNAKKTLDVNYRGTLAVCKAFLPLMRSETGRIVNVSSIGSSLKPFSPELQSRFRNARTLDDVETLALEFEYAVHNGTEAEAGWPSQRAYSVSKACVNGVTGVLAKENPVAINCCCPGWVNSDMGRIVGSPSKTLEEGARIPVRLALGKIDGVSGRYWANDSISGTGEGKVQEW